MYQQRPALFHNKEIIKEMAQDLNNEKLLFLQKFVDSGECIRDNLSEVSKKDALEFQEILKKHIKTVNLRGYS